MSRSSRGVVVVPDPESVTRSDSRATPKTFTKTLTVCAATAAMAAGLVAVPGTTAEAATPWTSYVVAGHKNLRDHEGRIWYAKPSRFTGAKFTRTRNAIAGTTSDRIFQQAAYGMREYVMAVPRKGTYKVTLYTTENYFRSNWRRMFAVGAEGRRLVDNIDIHRYSGGANKAYRINFSVTVTDGKLNIGFKNLRNYARVSAIRVIGPPLSTPARPAKTGPQPIKFAANNVWTQRVGGAPVDPRSAAVMGNLAHQVRSKWNGVAAFNVSKYNVAYYRVPRGTRRQTVAFHDCQGKGYTPAGLFNGAKHFVNVPIPANAAPAAGDDSQMSIYDPSTDQVWEFWAMSRNGRGWKACWGGRIDNASKNRGYFPGHYGSTATGLVNAAGMVSVEDIKRGRIDHALYLIVAEPKAGSYSWPASRTDGWSTNPNAVEEGRRLRLDPRVNVDALPLTRTGKIVAKAAQEYGFIVADKAGAVGVVTESGHSYAATHGGSDPWPALLGGTPEYEQLRNFPWHKMQMMPKNWGR
ncbi:MAG: hypothetical protein CSA58_00515 [Micrococcales bacterium]|nr:MAG: hypothetical protein CSB46_00645 [Micrococcales bacterium]PIE28150.1 MAG: hypothetical protein CSA58_00515 [Micrococcales bacterium]